MRNKDDAMENEVIMRNLTPADHAAHQRLMAQAFGRGRVQKEEDLKPGDEAPVDTRVGIFQGEGLQAALTIRPFVLHWPGAIGGTLSMGGIAGVATGIEARGRGYVDRLLRDSLVQMRDAGQVVSALYPFAWAFYRRFGWEWVGEKRSLTLPLREIKSSPEGKRVRLIPTEGAEQVLAPIYDRFSAEYRGAFATVSHQWKDKLSHSDDRTTYIYGYFPEGSDEPTAYLLWRYDGHGSDGGEVRELIANTPEGYRALLSLLHYLATQSRIARVTLPQDTPLWSYLMHWDLQTSLQPVFMGRVVDVCAAMERLVPAADLAIGTSVSIAVSDEAAPWNQGTFRIIVEQGALRCLPIEGETADVTLDIQAFSQAFWGMPSLTELRKAGRITITNAAGFGVLSRLLPAAPVFTMDFF